METINICKFADVEPLIRDRLMSTEYNNEHMNDLVKTAVAGDLWRTFYISLPSASIHITYDMIKAWGVNITDLESAVAVNIDGKSSVMPITAVIQQYLDTPPWTTPADALYVVTRSDDCSFCAASAILDHDVRVALDEMFPDGCHCLPSSRHEMLCVDVKDVDPDHLAHMVREINRSDAVEDEDILSDHVFLYHNGSFSVVV